jgi:hypothetical protein
LAGLDFSILKLVGLYPIIAYIGMFLVMIINAFLGSNEIETDANNLPF